MKDSNIKIVLCMFPDLDSARHIGTHAIKNQLAACVNLIPKVESIYYWNNEIKQPFYSKTHSRPISSLK